MNFVQPSISTTTPSGKPDPSIDIIQKSENSIISEYDTANSQLDVLGQTAGRLLYPKYSDPNDFTSSVSDGLLETYENALKIVEEFNQINNYINRLNFWDRNSLVFGHQSIIIIDTFDKKYEGFLGKSLLNFNENFSNVVRYRTANVLPSNPQQFVAFAKWVIIKYPEWTNPLIENESFYWEQISVAKNCRKYLIELLRVVEAERDELMVIQGHLKNDLYLDSEAADYFLSYGYQDLINNNSECFSSSSLFIIFQKLIICPLTNYASIVSNYYSGYYLKAKIEFLQTQKKRLDNGEDIRVPANDLAVVSDQLLIATNLVSSPKTKLKLQIGTDEKLSLLILPQMGTRLFKTLLRYTHKDDHDALKQLLDDGYRLSKSPIWIQLKAGSIAYIFKQALELDGILTEDVQTLARWLAAYLSWGMKVPKPVSSFTAYNVLRGNKPVTKINQIRLKPE